MNDAAFDALTAAAHASVVARIMRRGDRSLQAAWNTSWIARRIDRGLARWQSATAAQRLRAGLLVIGIGALTHAVLILPAPAPARSALPFATPLIAGGTALLGALAIRPGRRR